MNSSQSLARLVRRTVPLLLAGVLAGCATAEQAQEAGPTLGVAPGATVQGGFRAVSEARLDPAGGFDRLYVVGDQVLAVTPANAVYRLSAGLDVRNILGVVDAEDAIRTPVMLGERTVYPTNISLEIFDPSGRREKTVELPYALTSDVNVDARGLILAGVASPTGGRVVVIDPRLDYAVVVQQVLIGTVRGRPTSYQGTLYVTNDEGKVFAISGDNVAEWPMTGGAFRSDRSIRADLVVDDFGLYVASTDSVLYVLDRTTGRIRWRFMAEQPLVEAPVVTRDRVYQVVPEVGVVALDKLDGELYREPLWTVEGGIKVLAADERTVYILRSDKQLLAVDRNTGVARFGGDLSAFDLFAGGSGEPAIYAATRDGRVVRYEPNANAGLTARAGE